MDAATNTESNQPDLQEQIDRNLEVAMVAMDAELARRQREAWDKLRKVAPLAVREIEETRALQEKLFNASAWLAARRDKIFEGSLDREDRSQAIKI